MPTLRLLLAFTLLAVALTAGETPAIGAAPPAESPAQVSWRQRSAQVKDGDAEGWYRLSQWAGTQSLAAESRQALEKVIAVNPEHIQARKALGHEKIKDQWLTGDALYLAKGWTRHLGRWLSPADLQRTQQRQLKFRDMARQRADWSNAWELTTAHFKIKSNAAPRVVEEMAQAMEACMDTLVQIFQPRGGLPVIPLEIYATQEQFMRGSAMDGIPVSGGTLGYFWTLGNRSGIRCFYAGSIDRTLGVLFHECTHLVIKLSYGRDVPLWSNEGMAVFMEFAERQDKKLNIISVPWDRLWHLQEQIKEGTVSLNNLVGTRGDFYSVEYYPQGWSLTYFLLYANNGKYRNLLQGFYENRRRNLNPIVDFAATFGVSPDDMMKDWRPYFEKLEPRNVDELMSAALAAINYRYDATRALAYADAALAKAPTDWRTMLCRGRVLLNAARLAGSRPDAFTAAAAAFDQAAPGRPKFSKGKRPLREMLIDIDHALACAGAGNQQRALDLVYAVLDEDDLNSAGYRALAQILASANDPAARDLAAAKTTLQIADDFGNGPEHDHVRALIAAAENRPEEVMAMLQRAASQDAFGFGGMYYRAEAQRLLGGGGTEETIIVPRRRAPPRPPTTRPPAGAPPVDPSGGGTPPGR